MSGIVLPDIDLTSAVIGTTTVYDFSGILQVGINPLQVVQMGPPQLQFYNESPVGLRLQLAQSKRLVTLPAGGWAKVTIDADDKGFSWTPLYILATPALVNILLVTYLPPGDSGTDVVVLGNSPINGVVTLTNPDRIIDPATNVGIRVQDDGPGNEEMLIPTTINRGISLVGLDALAAQQGILQYTPNTADIEMGLGDGVTRLDTFFVGKISGVETIQTTNMGVPALVAHHGQAVNVTTLVTLFTYTPPGAAYYMALFWARMQNGTSPQNLTARVTYHDVITSTLRTVFFSLESTATNGFLTANGATAIGNAILTGQALFFYADSGTITIDYRDPGGTPADFAQGELLMIAHD